MRRISGGGSACVAMAQHPSPPLYPWQMLHEGQAYMPLCPAPSPTHPWALPRQWLHLLTRRPPPPITHIPTTHSPVAAPRAVAPSPYAPRRPTPPITHTPTIHSLVAVPRAVAPSLCAPPSQAPRSARRCRAPCGIRSCGLGILLRSYHTSAFLALSNALHTSRMALPHLHNPQICSHLHTLHIRPSPTHQSRPV